MKHRVYAVCTVDADSERDAREVAYCSVQEWQVCSPPHGATNALRNKVIAAIGAPAGVLIGGLIANIT